jgi:hypothetical protein
MRTVEPQAAAELLRPVRFASNRFVYCRSNLGADGPHVPMALGIQAKLEPGLQADLAVSAYAEALG